LSPEGGSKVILTEFWRTDTGKDLFGMLVSHNLKSLCWVSSIDSTIDSSDDIHEVAKWQFISKTHPPRIKFSDIIFSARGPMPLPSEMFSHFFVIFIFSANLYQSETGSDPVDKTKISGVVIELSL
jgi:hypothetical protein